MKNGAILAVLMTSMVWAPSAVGAQTDSANPPAAEDLTVDDIVVTAQRREERLQDVPIAVTALTGDMLADRGVTRTTDLTSVVPGLVLTKSVQVVTPFLRGVGNASTPPGNDPSIAVYLDGVYQSAPTGLLFTFNNIDRIEVLKGPQGTLFGRNATGGVISIVTMDPTAETGAKSSLGYANYDTVNASAYVSGGSEVVAADLSILYSKQHDGWGTNFFTPARAGMPLVNGVPAIVPPARREIGINQEFGLRSKVVVNLAELTRLEIAGRYVRTSGDQGLYRRGLPGAILSADGVTPYVPEGGFYDVNNDFPFFVRDRQWAVSGELQQELGFGTVKSISSYLDGQNNSIISSDATPFVSNTNQRQPISVRTFTQEFQLASNADSPFVWLVGTFYYRSNSGWTKDGGLHFVRGQLESTFDLFGKQRTESKAVFGQTTAKILPDTSLTGGLRYTDDSYAARQFNIGTRVSTMPLPPAQFRDGVITGNVPIQRTSANKITWRASLDHRFNQQVLGYASVSRGFKAGGFNLGGLCLNSPAPIGDCTNIARAVKSEVLDDYEVGLKTDLFDRRLRLNLSAFYYDYANLQVQSVVGLPPVSVLDNAASARVYGGEAEGSARLSDAFSINFGASILDAKYQDFPNAVIFVDRTAAPFNNAQVLLPNARGNRLNRAPKFTGNLGASYKTPTSMGELELGATYYYNSGFFWEVSNRLKQKSYGLLGGQISLTLPDDRWRVRLWAQNLTDVQYYSFQSATSSGDQGSPASPRTFGATLEWQLR